MKTKNKSKLALNKISIAHLDKVKIHEVKGGSPLIEDGLVVSVSNNISLCKTKTEPWCPIWA